jgi:hypothetical protein
MLIYDVIGERIMEPISIRYRLTEPEFMRACNAHWSVHRQSTLANLILGTVAILLGLILLFFTFWVALFLAIVGSILLLITWLRSLLWRRAFREAKKYNDDVSVVIKDDAIHVENAEGKSDLNWAFFTWYLDIPDHILLYATKKNFSVIPKRSFPDTRSIDRFLEIVEKKLKKIG